MVERRKGGGGRHFFHCCSTARPRKGVAGGELRKGKKPPKLSDQKKGKARNSEGKLGKEAACTFKSRVYAKRRDSTVEGGSTEKRRFPEKTES